MAYQDIDLRSPYSAYLCPLCLPLASAPCLFIQPVFRDWIDSGLFVSIHFFHLDTASEMWWICQKNRLRYNILPLIYKAIRTMNFILLLNSSSGYLLAICRISVSIGFLLPLYFIVPAAYTIDRTQNLERVAEKLPSCRNGLPSHNLNSIVLNL